MVQSSNLGNLTYWPKIGISPVRPSPETVAQLPWGHNVRILDTVKNADEREWYISQAVQNGWSRNVLVHQIESGLFQRQCKALTNFSRTLPEPGTE
jgi:hypothetical protein